MAFPAEIGWVGKNCPNHPKTRLVAMAMESPAGWFLGTKCPDEPDPGPHSRETGYYPTKQALVDAAFAGTLTWRDTTFKGSKLLANTTSMAFAPPDEPLSDMYAVICPIHGRQFLTKTQYDNQMNAPDDRWKCPRCGRIAHFDDDTYETAIDALEKAAERAKVATTVEKPTVEAKKDTK